MTVNVHQNKAAKKWLMVGACFALAVIIFFFVPEHAFCGSQNDPDTEAVLQAARNYLDAEVRRDYPAVYACFAPSSSYVRNHSYEQYLADARSATDRVVSYRIVDITYIKNYDARETSSAVDKISQVEVDVTFFNADTQYRSEVNIGFIFLKERGRWYKS